MVATQRYPLSPESRASTVCVDLDAFPSEGSGSCDSFILVSPVEGDRVSISSVNSDDDNLWWSRRRAAPAVPITISALVESVVQLSQISALSFVPMSANRVRVAYTYDTLDVFPVFQVSLDATEYLLTTSPVTPPELESLPTSPFPPDPESLPPGATVVQLYLCLSVTDRTSYRFVVIVDTIDSTSGRPHPTTHVSAAATIAVAGP